MTRMVLVVALVSCTSSSTGSSGPSTVPFPTAEDRWEGEPGVLGVTGTRTPAAASRADFDLRLTEPAACEQQIGLAVGSQGSVRVDSRPIVIPAGEGAVAFSADTSAFSGRPLDLQLFDRSVGCGPVKVSITESTVTFVP